MKKLKLTMATALLMGSTLAWGKGNLEVKSEAFIEKEVVAKDGTKSTKIVPAAKVIPGEEVIFVITYRNIGKEVATDVVITNPVPKHMDYKLAEAASPDIKSVVSVDGGKKYGDLASLKIKDKLRKTRPALPTDVTHVQWKLASNLKPNEEGKLQLRAVLQ